MTQHLNYNLIIVGGGMVGATLAIALKNTGLQIGLVEAYEPNAQQQASYDDRGIALAYGSQRIFQTMGLWKELAGFSSPIKHIHVSDRGQFGVTRLHAEHESVPALGHVITAKHLGSVLYKYLAEQANLDMHCPARVDSFEQNDKSAQITLADGTVLSSKLVVAADGADSTIRKLLHLGELNVDYQQTAITANVSTERAHNNWAFERFTETGPIALLPMSENRCSLVWTVKSGDETDILNMDDSQFLHKLQQRFGFRLGHFTKVGQRNSYPLHLRQADQPIQSRVVLIGNAAHSLHPIAGQGFNLGLRDVVALADVITDYPSDCGDARALTDYRNWRFDEQDNVVNATGSLVNLFSNSNPLLAHARGASLALMETVPLLKHLLARKSMGLSGKQPRLARGIKL